MSRASPGLGTWSKQWKPSPRSKRSVWSTTLGASTLEATRERWQGTIARSSMTVNEIPSCVSVRSVATSVPTGTRTASFCAADSQKVTSTLAAVGGKRRIPISSRNLT